MLPEIESFGHLMIARRAGGEPVEVVRSPDEVVFLAFDTKIKRLVELHVLRSGSTLDSVAKRSAFDRAKQAAEIRGPAFMRILEVGEDHGLVYYTSNLNDGEFVEDYVERRGALASATVFSLVFQLLDDLLQLRDYQRLVSNMRLDRVVVSTLEDTFLQLRIYDYGLSANEVSDGAARMVIQACELMFLMLTGKEYAGDNPDRFPALTSLPMSLRITLRTALADPGNAPTSLEKLRDDVREAFGALVSSIQARNSRKQLVVTPALQPASQLQNLLLENVPVEIILGNRFRVEDAEHVRRYPFSIPAFNARNEQPVTVHLLPPSRIVDKTQYEAVPLQMWRFNTDKHPNILRSLSVWESPDWTFLTEEREPGFALSRLMAERLSLNPSEVLVLMKQVRAGLDQAQECGVERLDLHPSNIVLRVGKAGPLLSREYERLMQKRLDAWPPFLVKLRAHLTMRNLYEPLLVDRPEDGQHAEEHLADRDYRHRAFVALTAYLLTGERQTAGLPRFPEAVPETLAIYMRELLEQMPVPGRTPAPADFLDRFEAVLNGPATPVLASRIVGTSVPIEEMESAGSVSDFDNEWGGGEDEADSGAAYDSKSISRTLKTHDFSKRSGVAWPVWAAAAAVVLGGVVWWLMATKGEVAQPAPAGSVPLMAESIPVIPEKAEVASAPVVVNSSAEAVVPEPGTGAAKPVNVAVASHPTPVAKIVEATSAPAATTAPAPIAALAPAPVAVPPAAATTEVASKAPTDAGSSPANEAPSKPPATQVTGTTVMGQPRPEDRETPPALSRPIVPPAPVTVPNPVIIRKALVPSPEEIAKFKQGLVKPEKQQLPAQVSPEPQTPMLERYGAIPAMNLARPRAAEDDAEDPQ